MPGLFQNGEEGLMEWPDAAALETFLRKPARSPADVDRVFSYLRECIQILLKHLIEEDRLLFLESMIDKFIFTVSETVDVGEEAEEIHRLIVRISGQAPPLREAESTVRELQKIRHSISSKSWPARSFARKPLRRTTSELSEAEERYAVLLFSFQNVVRDLYRRLLNAYNVYLAARNNTENHFEFYGFYLPDTADKVGAAALLKESAELVMKEKLLTQDARAKLADRIKNGIVKLNLPKSPWPQLLGEMRENMIIMNAMSGMLSAAAALQSAADRLREAMEIIEKTSVNGNYINLENNSLTQHGKKGK